MNRPETVQIGVEENEKLIAITRRAGEGILIEGVGEVVIGKVTGRSTLLLIKTQKNTEVKRVSHN